MNVLTKVTLQALKRNRVRTIVTIIGVMLSVAMLTGTTTAIFSLQNYLRQAAEETITQNGDWHIRFNGMDAAFAQKLDTDDAVKTTALVQNVGCALLQGSQNQDRPYLFVAGFNDQAFETLPVKLLSGRMPQGNSEIIISEQIQSDGGINYTLGDTVTLEIGQRIRDDQKLGPHDGYLYSDEVQENHSEIYEEIISEESFQPQNSKTFTVVGVCADPMFLYSRAPGYPVITKMDTQSPNPDSTMASASNSFDVYVTLHSPTPDQVLDFATHHFSAPDPVIAETSDGFAAYGTSGWEVNNNLYSDTYLLLYTVGGLLIALIMAGSILLIYNSFSLSVGERICQFGILSSVGATHKQLCRSVILEGISIGIIGIPLGILAGSGGILALRQVGNFLGEPFGVQEFLGFPTLSVSVMAMAAAALLGVAVILVSAYIPARKAAKISAIDSIRRTKDVKSDIKIETKAVKTSKRIERFFGWEGVLARKNFKRNKRRYRATILSLFVSVVLFISANTFGLYLKQNTTFPYNTSEYNIEFYTLSRSLSTQELFQLYDRLKSVPGITSSGYQTAGSYCCVIPTDNFSASYREHENTHGWPIGNDEETRNMGLGIEFLDDATYLDYLRDLDLPESEYTGNNAKLPAITQIYNPSSNQFLTLDMFSDMRPKTLTLLTIDSEGDVFQPQGDSVQKEVSLTFSHKIPKGRTSGFTGIIAFAPYSSISEYKVLDDPNMNNLSVDDPRFTRFFFSSEEPGDTAEEMKGIIRESETRGAYELRNIWEEQEEARTAGLIINIFVYGFIGLLSLIAIANMFNTISSTISLRRREFAMLRSVGMSASSFKRTIAYECLSYGIRALILGLPVSIGIACLIYERIRNANISVPFMLPWGSMGISILSVFMLLFITMLYGISKVNKENTIDSLKNDML